MSTNSIGSDPASILCVGQVQVHQVRARVSEQPQVAVRLRRAGRSAGTDS